MPRPVQAKAAGGGLQAQSINMAGSGAQAFGSSQSRRDLSNVKCFKCGQMGHIASSCKAVRISSPLGDVESLPRSQEQVDGTVGLTGCGIGCKGGVSGFMGGSMDGISSGNMCIGTGNRMDAGACGGIGSRTGTVCGGGLDASSLHGSSLMGGMSGFGAVTGVGPMGSGGLTGGILGGMMPNGGGNFGTGGDSWTGVMRSSRMGAGGLQNNMFVGGQNCFAVNGVGPMSNSGPTIGMMRGMPTNCGGSFGTGSGGDAQAGVISGSGMCAYDVLGHGMGSEGIYGRSYDNYRVVGGDQW